MPPTTGRGGPLDDLRANLSWHFKDPKLQQLWERIQTDGAIWDAFNQYFSEGDPQDNPTFFQKWLNDANKMGMDEASTVDYVLCQWLGAHPGTLHVDPDFADVLFDIFNNFGKVDLKNLLFYLNAKHDADINDLDLGWLEADAIKMFGMPPGQMPCAGSQKQWNALADGYTMNPGRLQHMKRWIFTGASKHGPFTGPLPTATPVTRNTGVFSQPPAKRAPNVRNLRQGPVSSSGTAIKNPPTSSESRGVRIQRPAPNINIPDVTKYIPKLHPVPLLHPLAPPDLRYTATMPSDAGYHPTPVPLPDDVMDYLSKADFLKIGQSNWTAEEVTQLSWSDLWEMLMDPATQGILLALLAGALGIAVDKDLTPDIVNTTQWEADEFFLNTTYKKQACDAAKNYRDAKTAADRKAAAETLQELEIERFVAAKRTGIPLVAPPDWYGTYLKMINTVGCK
ncbi:MAG: hypothetical protein Q8902_15375 [Bacteroidota bacterium]|nr:hypothetical protein [Bacteroidota bacterium]MDP4234683.1 hypothetical protein [Bacteroidota bacterium]MDP4243846.1 hypothetical protein [Bacteroidota bacterium]